MSGPVERPYRTLGPWPFVTKIIVGSGEHAEQIWNSRQHRKGFKRRVEAIDFAERCWRGSQSIGDLNWWIGSLFAAGSLLFAFGSVLTLSPSLARDWSLSMTGVNGVYFVGSLPFTVAAYLQLYQAANSPEFKIGATLATLATAVAGSPRQIRFGWSTVHIGWLSAALQFSGTLLFNVNTFAAMIPQSSWLWHDLVVWVPDLVGSILFLASGYLAFIETCHAYWAWRPGGLSWWVTWFNLLGCLGFMCAAVFAIIVPGSTTMLASVVAPAFVLQGAICFFAGSCLMLPELVSD